MRSRAWRASICVRFPPFPDIPERRVFKVRNRLCPRALTLDAVDRARKACRSDLGMVMAGTMERSAFDAPYRGGFVGTRHHFALTVYFEDTDTAGIVYYANYLKYMERARSDMLRAAGIDQRAAIDDGTGVYAVADVAIRYLRSARLDDDLVILSDVVTVRAASVVIHQRVMRGSELLTDARVTAAFLTPDGRPTRQPAGWVERFRALSTKGT